VQIVNNRNVAATKYCTHVWDLRYICEWKFIEVCQVIGLMCYQFNLSLTRVAKGLTTISWAIYTYWVYDV